MNIRSHQSSQRMPQSNPHRESASSSSMVLRDMDDSPEPMRSRRGRPPRAPGIRGRIRQRRSQPRILKSQEFVIDSSAEDGDDDDDDDNNNAKGENDKNSASDSSSGEEDEVTCAICHLGHSPDNNPIVYCEGRCNLAYHQMCYGILEVPPGDDPWYCDWCSSNNRTLYGKNLFCCHYKDDKTARTLIIKDKDKEKEERPSEFKFIHIHCAAWSPEINTNEIPFTTTLTKLKGDFQKCCICNARFGFQVHCKHVNADGSPCENSFHPMCAIRNNFIPRPTVYNYKYKDPFCPTHIPLVKGMPLKRPLPDSADDVNGPERKRLDRHPTSTRLTSSGSRTSMDIDSRPLLTRGKSISTPPPKKQLTLASAMTQAAQGSSRSANAVPKNQSTFDYADVSGNANMKQALASLKPMRRVGRLPQAIIDEASDASSMEQATSSKIRNGRFSQGIADDRATAATATGGNASDDTISEDMELRIRPKDKQWPPSNRSPPRSRPIPSFSTDRSRSGAKEPKKIMLTFPDNDRPHPHPRSESPELASNAVGGSHGASMTHAPMFPMSSPPLDASADQPGNGYIHGSVRQGSSDREPTGSPQLPQLQQPMVMAPPVMTKRQTIRIKPFVRSIDRRPSVQEHPGALSATAASFSFDSSKSATEITSIAEKMPELVSTVAGSSKMSQEQLAWMKESREVLDKHTEMLSKIHELVNELSTQPAKQVQTAMSTISSLTALIPRSDTAIAASKPSTVPNGSEKSSDPAAGPSQYPRPAALSLNKLFSKSGSRPASTVADKAPEADADKRPPTTLTSAPLARPLFSLPAPTPLVATPSSPALSSTTKPATPGASVNGKASHAQSPERVSNGTSQTGSQSPAQLENTTSSGGEPQGAELSAAEIELKELKADATRLFRMLDLGQALLDKANIRRPGMLRPLIEDMKKLGGTMKEENISVFIKTILRHFDSKK